MGNKAPTVKRIKEKAGLEREYEHIKSLVPARVPTTDIFEGFTSNCPIRKHVHPTYHNGIIYALNKLDENSNTSAEVKNLIAKAKTYSDINAKSTSQLWKLTDKIVKLVSNPSFDKLMEKSEKLLNEVAPTNDANTTIPKCVDEKYYTALKMLMEQYKNGLKISKDELESTYNAVAENVIVPQIEAVYVNDQKCKIDTNTHTVTALSNKTISANDIYICTGENTILTRTVKNLNPGESQFVLKMEDDMKHGYLLLWKKIIPTYQMVILSLMVMSRIRLYQLKTEYVLNH